MTEEIDKFQQRYLEHQKIKKQQLISIYGEKNKNFNKNMQKKYLELLKNRRSQRIFNSEAVTQEELDYILSCLVESPSSCNRQAISIKIIEDRTLKELLGGLLVGGVGWCHRANKIILLFSNIEAYKEKLDYMPYLDSGVLILNTYLACESLGIGCCFINPNIRDENKKIFEEKFSKNIFCGALAIGHYDKKSFYSSKIDKKEILI